jgi:hypothetical protein
MRTDRTLSTRRREADEQKEESDGKRKRKII